MGSGALSEKDAEAAAAVDETDAKAMPANAEAIFPDVSESPQVIANAATSIGMAVKLSDDDKLAADHAMSLSSYVSVDNGKTWQFVNGCTWRSYGSKGLTVKDFGADTVNPNPRLSTPCEAKQEGLVRLIVEPAKAMTASVEFASKE